MVCLETTFIVDLLRGKHAVKEIKDELDGTESLLTIAAPTIMEVWTGALLSNMTAHEKAKINELLSSLVILHLDERSSKEAGEIEAELIKSGKIAQTEDVMIAGIARINGERIVTRDADYARIPGLKILKY
jgi:hypothetical protein